MKYRQLVSMPSSVSDWLEEQLEVNGIDAVVYTRYLLSILYNATVDVIGSDEDLQHSQSKKEVGGDKHLHHWNSEWWRYADIDAEQLKRSSAVQCLLSASDQTDAIESLIDELCDKLNAEPAESTTEPLLPSPMAYSSQELAEQYYSTFPSLPTSIWTTKLFEKEEGQESRSGYKMDAVNKPSVTEESIEMDQEPVHFDRIIRRPSRASSYVNENTKSIVHNMLSFLEIPDEVLEKTHTWHEDRKFKHKNYAVKDEYENNAFRYEHKNKAFMKAIHDYSYMNSPSYSLWVARNESRYYPHWNREHKDALESEKRNLFSALFNRAVGSDPGSIWADENAIRKKGDSKHGKHENDAHMSEKHHSYPNYNPLSGPHWLLTPGGGKLRNNAPSNERINRLGEHKDALKSEKHDLLSVFNRIVGSDPGSTMAYGNEIRIRSKHGKLVNDAHMSEKHHHYPNYNPLSRPHRLLDPQGEKLRNDAFSGEHMNRNGEHNDALKNEKRDHSVFNPIVGSDPGSIWADENVIRIRIGSKHGKHENDAHMNEKHHDPNYNPLLRPHRLLNPRGGKPRNNASSHEHMNRDKEHNDALKSEKHDLLSVFNPIVGSDPGSIWADENVIRIRIGSKHRKHENDAHMSEKHHAFSNDNPLSGSELHSIKGRGKHRNNSPSREGINRDGEHNDACKSEKHDQNSVFNPVVGSDRYSVRADDNEVHKKDDGRHENDEGDNLSSEYDPLSDSELHSILAALIEECGIKAPSLEEIANAFKEIERYIGLQAGGYIFDDRKWNDSFPSASSSASSSENDKDMDNEPMTSCLGDLCSNNGEHHVCCSWWEGFQERRKIRNTDRAYDEISLSHSLFTLKHDDKGPFIIASLNNSPRTEHKNSSASSETATSTKSALDRSDYKFLASLDTNFIPIEVQEKRNRGTEIDLSESDEESNEDEQTDDGGYPRDSSSSVKVPPELLKSFISKSKFYSSNKCCQAEVEEHEVFMICTTDDAEDDTNEEFVETNTPFSQEQHKESLDYKKCAEWSMWGTGPSNEEAGEDAPENVEEDLEWDNNTLRNLWNIGNLMANSQAYEFCRDRVRRNLFWEREIEPQDHDADWQEISCALDTELTRLQRESPVEGLRMYQLFGPSSKRNMKILKESTCLPASSSFFEENCITQMPTLHTVTL